MKNYIYFNGKNSSLTFKLNENPTNINSNFPTLENGLTLFFCFYMKKNLMTQFYELNEKNKTLETKPTKFLNKVISFIFSLI